MPTNRIRKCTIYGNLPYYKNLNASTTLGFSDYGFDDLSKQLRFQLLEAYGNWINEWMQQGWDGYLITFMFHNLSGAMSTQISQMHEEVTKVFSKLVTRMVRKPRSPNWVPLLPKGVFVPDLPVVKKTKVSVREASTNNGLHMHGVLLAHRWGRLNIPLDLHFEEKRATYQTGKIRTIDVKRIDYDPGYVTEYAGKGLKRPCFNTDHILILPRSLSELPDCRFTGTISSQS